MSDLCHWLRTLTASRLVGPLLIVVAGVLLPACQSTMSVEEAKKIAASFAGTSFVPPPRTIQDILMILDQQPPADAPTLQANVARLEQFPPSTTDPHDLVVFYLARGTWAHDLGRVRQAIEDLRQAVDHARLARSTREHYALQRLALAEFQGGSLSSAINHLKEAVSRVPLNSRGSLVTENALLAGYEATLGNSTAADAAIGDARTVLNESAGWQGTPLPYRLVLREVAAYGEAMVAEARGQFANAEVLIREAIDSGGQANALGYHIASDPAFLA